MKIAICFFGLSRSLPTTLDSIERHVVAPCRAHGETVKLAHLYYQNHVASVRSGEDAPLDPDDYRLLGLDAVSLQFTPPSHLSRIVDEMKPHGDAWKNDFSSLGNLIRQLYSLQAVATVARSYTPDLVVFCRPDLLYHDSLAPVLDAMAQQDGDVVALPDWQHWERGYNDRFAVCRGRKAAQAYGGRLSLVNDYVTEKRRPLHSERLLRYALERADIRTMVFPQRASRVRAGGIIVEERFSRPKARRLPYLYTPPVEAAPA